MADTLIDLLTELQELTAALKQIVFGSDSESVTHDGVTRATVAKQITDSYNEIQALVDGQIPYATLALAQAAGEPPTDGNGNHKLYRVVGDPASENNGLYYWDGSALVRSQYDPIGHVDKSVTDLTKMIGQSLGDFEPRTTGVLPVYAERGRALIWTEEGEIKIAGYTNSGDSIKRYSDGGNLVRLRRKLALLRQGVSADLRIALMGDSWTELTPIPQALRDHVDTVHGSAGEGFVSVKPGSWAMDTVTVVASGWTVFDMTSDGSPDRSMGPDGHAMHTTSATATYSASGLSASSIKILHWDGDGSWRYRVDDGSWVSVAGASSNTVQTLTISGLSSANTLEIDTTGNAGVVEIYGFVVSGTGNGCTVLKIGNGSSRGDHWSAHINHIDQWSSVIDPDVVIVVLGTNDTRLSAGNPGTPETLAQGISDIASVYSDSDIIYVYPPGHGAAVTETGSLADFRDAALSRCNQLGIDYYDGLVSWGSSADEYSAGFWVSDLIHLTDLGAVRLIDEINDVLLGIK